MAFRSQAREAGLSDSMAYTPVYVELLAHCSSRRHMRPAGLEPSAAPASRRVRRRRPRRNARHVGHVAILMRLRPPDHRTWQIVGGLDRSRCRRFNRSCALDERGAMTLRWRTGRLPHESRCSHHPFERDVVAFCVRGRPAPIHLDRQPQMWRCTPGTAERCLIVQYEIATAHDVRRGGSPSSSPAGVDIGGAHRGAPRSASRRPISTRSCTICVPSEVAAAFEDQADRSGRYRRAHLMSARGPASTSSIGP